MMKRKILWNGYISAIQFCLSNEISREITGETILIGL